MERNNSEASHGSVASYIAGFVLSLMLTLTAYLLVLRHVNSHHSILSHGTLVFMLVGLALTQLIVQLIFFLHLDRESKPHWNMTVLLFAVTVVVIIVFGSLWIMDNLNYHHPSAEQINKYIRSQGDL
jgi:cytochrome o ubiquinol oxidase operon protein cyoD